MTAYTSAGTGDWGTAGTWSPSGVPAAGDTVTIGAHTVTVSGSETFGTDPTADTTELDLGTAGGILNITGTLTCEGSMNIAQGELRCAAGSTLQWDVTNAQRIFLGEDFNGAGKIRINGTSGNRVTWQLKPSGGSGDFRIDFHNGNGMPQDLEADYWDCSDLGSASTDMMDASMAGTYNDNMNLNQVVFDNCGDWHQNTFMHADATFIWNNVTFVNHAGSNNCSFNWYNSIGTGTRTLNACVFDKTPRFWGFQGATVTNNLFQDTFTTISEAVASETLWSGNLVVHDGANVNLWVDITDDVWIITDNAKTNPHGPNTNTGNVGNLTYDGLIFELISTNSDGDGDWILVGTPGSGSNTLTVQNCVVVPGGSDNAPTLLTALGDAFSTVNCYHNTIYVNSTAAGGDNEAGIVVGETYAGFAGMFEAKSNIFWTDKASATNYTCQDSTGTTSDLAAAADINYNCGYNITDAAALATNGFSLSAGSHDANSINEDPSFVDATRNMAAWDTSLGGAGSMANALTELAKLNDASGYDSNYTIAALSTYIKGGFAPTNQNLENAGHDAATIGAVAYTAASSGTAKDFLLLGVG